MGTNPNAHTFGFDLAGNRTAVDATAATFDSGNKLLTFSSGGTSYTTTHDTDGNLTQVRQGGYYPIATFNWDDLGNLTSQAGSGGYGQVTYGYDGFGRRIWSQPYNQPKTYYVFDGDLLLGEIQNPTPPYNPTGFVAGYTWGAAGLVSERVGSVSLTYHFGPQGETRALTNSTGTLSDTYVYTAWGEPGPTTGSDRNPFRYGGQFGYYTDTSSTIGTILCGARWYYPAIGRWISRDPSGYSGGFNLYEYCAGDPANLIDPDGSQGIGARIKGAMGWCADKITTPFRWSWSLLKDAFKPTFRADAPSFRKAWVESGIDVDMQPGYALRQRGHEISEYIDETMAGIMRDVAIGALTHTASARRAACPSGGGGVPWVTSMAATDENIILSVLQNIKDGTLPSWRVGKWGARFGNYEGFLPRGVNYAEYYLPKSIGDTTSWGANRLVLGSDGAVYYTWNHYRNFVRVR